MIEDLNIRIPDGLDYEGIRNYGLEYIKAIGGKLWTDFNAHDPGVTILEALSFALTDLSFRTSADIGDLLTKAGEERPELSGSLFPAHEILTSNPCTLEDYRKYILENVPGIRDVKIEPKTIPVTIYKGPDTKETVTSNVKGFYDVIIDPEGREVFMNDKVRTIIGRDEDGRYSDRYFEGENYFKYLSHYVKNMLLKHRNLCEDFDEVKIKRPVHICLNGGIEIRKGVDCHKLLQTIYDKVSEYVAPALHFYTIEELVASGKSPADIYGGEIPRYGFLDKEELKKYRQRKKLLISDIKNILMQIDGVVSIQGLSLYSDTPVALESNTSYSAELKDGYSWHFPHFFLNQDNYYVAPEDLFPADEDYPADMYATDPELKLPVHRILLTRSDIPFLPSAVDAEIVPRVYERKPLEKGLDKTFPLKRSRYKDVGTYYSFQNVFPKNYKLGMERIADSETKLRKASRLQLKAYLTFFDRILADYLAQLENLAGWFSINASESGEYRTYYHKLLSDDQIVDLSEVLDDGSYGADVPEYVDIDRKSRLFDHLMARFNETFVDYSTLKFLAAGGRYDSALEALSAKESLEDKKRMLRSLPEITGRRAQAMDYTEHLYVSGIERRILHKLGVNDPDKMKWLAPERLFVEKTELGNSVVHYVDNSADPYDCSFGIHIIDHITLLPENSIQVNPRKPSSGKFLKLSNERKRDKYLQDPYSFQVTVIAPGWLNITKNAFFRQFAERVIREEMPAHIVAKICWLDPYVMERTERAYRKVLKALSARAHPFPADDWYEQEVKAIESMLDRMDELYNLYPSSTLGTEDDFATGDMRLDYVRLEDWEVEGVEQKWKLGE